MYLIKEVRTDKLTFEFLISFDDSDKGEENKDNRSVFLSEVVFVIDNEP